MAKARKVAKGKRLSSSQVRRLRELLERALLDAKFRKRLLANPGRVLEQYRIGLTPAQLRRFESAKKAVIQRAREVQQRAVEGARALSKQAKVMGWPTIN